MVLPQAAIDEQVQREHEKKKESHVVTH
jgi:hypothetical protein